jgi:DNA-binding GntR family transcriptional regulator
MKTGVRAKASSDGALAAWPLAEVRRLQTLPEQIAERIYAAIVAGEFAPGDRIREESLAEAYQVSRGPIREALRILEKDSVVRMLPNRGAHVTKLSIKEVNDIFEIRKVLAGAMVRRLGDRDPGVIARIAERVAELEELAQDPAAAADYVAGTVQLSLTMAQASGNERLAEIMKSLARQSWRYTQVGLATPARRKESARNWRTLLKALMAKQVEAAAKAMEKLVDDARQEAVRMLETGVHGAQARAVDGPRSVKSVSINDSHP